MSKQAEGREVLRAMTTKELEDHLKDHRRKLFEVRFQQVTGHVENYRELRVIRREIARTMTVQSERERQEAGTK